MWIGASFTDYCDVRFWLKNTNLVSVAAARGTQSLDALKLRAHRLEAPSLELQHSLIS